MAESFITHLNGVITGKHHGDMNAYFYGTPYYGHNRTHVPFDAEVTPMDLITFYDENWKRKTDVQLIKEGLLPIPKGYVLDGDILRGMSAEERVAAGLDEPPEGYKFVDGELIEMSAEEKIEVGLMTQEEYDTRRANDNNMELQSRLAELQTPEVLAQAEVDETYAAARKAKLAALLAVKTQALWPLEVVWPQTA